MSRYKNVALVLMLVALGKATGFLKDLAFTFYHGVSSITDAYFLANSIASVIYMAIYSAIPVLIVPLYSRLLTAGCQKDIDNRLSSGFFFFSIISMVVAVCVFGASHWLVVIFSGEVSGQVREFASVYLSIMALTFVLSTVVSLLNSVQSVNGVVIPSYIVPVVNNVIFCGGLYLYNSDENFHQVLILGFFSWLFLVFVNLIISRRYFSFRLSSAFSYFSERKFISIFLPALMSFYVEQLNSFVGVFFATELGVGAVSIFAYANKLNLIFLSVFLVFLTASLFPRIAAVVARNNQAELLRYLTACIRIVVICSFPIVLYMSFYSHEIVAVLFHRGKFLSGDVIKVASIFSIVLLVMPLCLIRDIMNRVFFSHSNTLTPVLLSLVSLGVNYLVCSLFYIEYGLVALAVAFVASTIVNCTLAIYFVQRDERLVLFIASSKILLICSIGAVAAYGVLYWLNQIFASYWLVIFLPFAVVYFFGLYLLRVREVIVVGAHLRSLLLKLGGAG
ncbi:lipid II flippase MurJ [Pseudomonas corrugata]|uniref:murein biosynthesis integral membrane protein MurJ n=1 Tax=Pseudomonas corrugata TaxID=47879 RepID=UPI0028C3CDC3|nr:lipid II flippase MurJ [Pseudomonas corrugata]MDU9037527.1 lipid II flippase MurJ [Pseudomonas corrugata]